MRIIPGNEDDIEAFCLNTYETPLRIALLVRGRIEGVAGALVASIVDTKDGSVFNGFLSLCEIVGVTLFADMNPNMVPDLVNPQPETLEPLTRRRVAKDGCCAF